MITPQPILVTGIERSGSSLIAGVLNICGAFGGVMDRYCENLRIMDNVMIPYLLDIKADGSGQYPLPNVNRMPIPVDWAQRVFDCIKEDGYKGGPWMYKGFRICQTWPVWHYAFPNAKWVVVRRRTGDIIHSCSKTEWMKAFRSPFVQKSVGVTNERDGWLHWVHWHEARFVEMITEGLNVKVIWPEKTVYGDYSEMMETIEWLGLRWTSEALSYADPKLWKSRRNGNRRLVEVNNG